MGHRPGVQHQGSAATRKSRAVAAPRSARFPREQLSVQVEGLPIFQKMDVVGLIEFIVVTAFSGMQRVKRQFRAGIARLFRVAVK